MTPHHEAARKAADETPCKCGTHTYIVNNECDAEKDGYLCTRVGSHSGPHIACDNSKVIRVWDNTHLPATGGNAIGHITLADAVRHDSPAGFMVFCHNDIDHDYLIFTDERDAKDYAFEQEEKSQSEEGAWPVYALWASDWPVKRDAARREAK